MGASLIILAAGQGTRMQSDLPKVLHRVAHAPLLAHAMRAGSALAPERVVVVAGHGAAEVEKAVTEIDDTAHVVIQQDRLGTGHAVLQARAALEDTEGDAIVLYGDTPFIRPETLQAMLDARARHAVVVLGFEPADPARYGRLFMQGGSLEAVIEYKDATEAQRTIPLCNSGVICADAARLFSLLDEVTDDNAAGEYYLTDIVALARRHGLSCGVVRCDEAETMGVNSRADLAAAEAAFQQAKRAEALANGATLTAPGSVHFAWDTWIGRDATVEPYVMFGPGVTIETGAVIHAFSHLEGCHVSAGARVGPYARLRPGAELANNARVGNFVEIKNAEIAEGAKVNHLSYIGDATVGEAANIGAGTVTCNYDGVSKHRTEIGARAFIGSSTMLVAPVTIGAEALIASGSVITEDVPEGALAVARGRQANKPGLARKLMARLRAARAAKAARTEAE